ncbi:MAG: polyprenyl synthetase family protein [Candidatus Schekmanbacteria bacterium]|nr:MAG: polyprenyl synthetase family protein [Candidatus Schekmanbacteria bacterium]
MEIEKYIKARKKLINEELDRLLPNPTTYPQSIKKSMRYSTFAGGKRLRPILCLATCESLGGSFRKALPFACAIEMIHTYSLIHDDLPALDNDDFRRGMPTNHKKFGESTAILTGDALLTYAFQIMTAPETIKRVGAEKAVKISKDIADKAGIFGMIGGQVADIESEKKNISKQRLRFIHLNKTAALITASIRTGAIVADCSKKELEKLTNFGEKIGLAFQIKDDILNVEGSKDLTGKSVGSDAEKGKATYPALYGLEKSKKIAKKLIEESDSIIESMNLKFSYLKDIAQMVLSRNN